MFIFINSTIKKMQKRFYFLVALIIILEFPVKATHIVGGEFELEHLEGYNYELRLIQYFDDYYGNKGAEDQLISASIFQKSNNSFVESITLNNTGSTAVEYTNMECAIGELITRKIIYKTNLYLDPTIYNHPEGYYVVWERCCRNNVIDNIVAPEAAGQSFYLEFPPVIKNGEQFINSSPQLFPPLSDYGCVGQYYYVDFTGTDADNDSLAYTLVDPIRGFSSQAQPAPPPSPAPYPKVNWVNGISTNNMVPGNPSLQITEKGLLTVTPSQAGLFVFSVKCEEFRDGTKIGEVVRDFQMLVIDCPPAGNKPELFVKIKGEDNFYNNQVISFSENQPKCIQVFVKDADPMERIKFRIAPVNFNGERNIFPRQQGVINGANDTLVMDLCFPECALSDDEIAVFDLIAMDDQCSQPLMDSVRLRINQIDTYNQQPFFTNNDLEVTIDEGENYNFTVTARDNDLDSIALNLVPVGFDLTQYGITFVPVKVENGLVQYQFAFDASCGQYDFKQNDVFEVNFLANDFNQCNNGQYDTLTLKINVNLPVNTSPSISLNPAETELSVRIDQSIIFDVLGNDLDNDLITLSAFGVGFDMQSVGMVFNGSSGFGSTQSRFTWRLNCEQINLASKDEYKVVFQVEDKDDCLLISPDTISVNITARPPRNERPQVFTEIQPFRTISINPGDSLNFAVLAVDNDGDNLTLDLKDLELLSNQYGFEFEPISGGSRVITDFSWLPSCDLLAQGGGPRVINLKFFATDDKCFNNRADTTTVEVILADRAGKYDAFDPINVFTPNGDDINEFFFLDDLPIDNCRAEFIDINIFNRWGKPLFYSKSRDFAWNGDQAPSGVYYYVIQYTNDLVYKGTVSIIR